MKIECPNCGSDVKYLIKERKMHCDSCNQDIDIKDFDIKNIYQDSNIFTMYNCGSCGAKLVVESNTILTNCAFCKSQQIIKENISGEYKPDYIVPFKCDQDDFSRCVDDYLSNYRFLPKKIKKANKLVNIRALYVPYYLYYYDVDTLAIGLKHDSGRCIPIRRGGIVFDSSSKVIINVDGSEKIDDSISSSICNFNFNDMIEFNPLYMCGMQGERPDVNNLNIDKLAVEKAYMHSMKLASKYVPVSDLVSGEYNVDVNSYEPRHLVLLPIWFADLDYKGKLFPIVMNGQNSSIISKMPINKFKISILFLIIIILLIIIVYSFIISATKIGNFIGFGGVFIVCISGVLALSFLIHDAFLYHKDVKNTFLSVEKIVDCKIKLKELYKDDNLKLFKKKYSKYLKKPNKKNLSLDGKPINNIKFKKFKKDVKKYNVERNNIDLFGLNKK